MHRLKQLLARSRSARLAVFVFVVAAALAGLYAAERPAEPPSTASAAATPAAASASVAAVPRAGASAASASACTVDADSLRWSEMARRGELDALAALADNDPKKNNDALAYKWLEAAADYGHFRAEVLVKHLRDNSSLRYDDDELVVGWMHHELGLAYLSGCDGLPEHPQFARRHLALGRDGVLGTQHDLDDDRRNLSAAARKVFDEIHPPAAGKTGPRKSG